MKILIFSVFFLLLPFNILCKQHHDNNCNQDDRDLPPGIEKKMHHHETVVIEREHPVYIEKRVIIEHQPVEREYIEHPYHRNREVIIEHPYHRDREVIVEDQPTPFTFFFNFGTSPDRHVEHHQRYVESQREVVVAQPDVVIVKRPVVRWIFWPFIGVPVIEHR
jgi:hypothetical protein